MTDSSFSTACYADMLICPDFQEDPVVEWRVLAHLGPPCGQHEVGVDIVFSELLRNVQAQGAVRVVDVPPAQVRQNGVGVVQFLEFLRRLGVVWVLVRVVPQRQLPDSTQQSSWSSATQLSADSVSQPTDTWSHLYDFRMSSWLQPFSRASTWYRDSPEVDRDRCLLSDILTPSTAAG